jgi:hypothetical protein
LLVGFDRDAFDHGGARVLITGQINGGRCRRLMSMPGMGLRSRRRKAKHDQSDRRSEYLR